VTILITGESGTGKEVIADLTHAMSQRSKSRIIKINCAALPRETHRERTVRFGQRRFHRRAQPTAKVCSGRPRMGRCSSTRFPRCRLIRQSKLLRVLQDQEVRPIGGTTSYKTNCRLIAATNRRPEEAIKDGKLPRGICFYRISAISVHLAPLRERREDIMPLGQRLLETFRGASQPADPRIYAGRRGPAHRLPSGPANVRQLQNEIQRAVVAVRGRSGGTPADLSVTRAQPGGEESQDTNFTLLEGVERNAIVQMLKDTNGNKLEAAKRLGIGRQTLYNKIKAYGIEV